MSISLNGTWIQNVAMGWLVYRLTGSLVLLATVTFMSQIPNLVITPFVSTLIDRYNKRNLLIITQAVSAAQAIVLGILTITGKIEIWHIISLSLVLGCANSLDIPTRQAFYTSLVPASRLGNAIALNSTVINGAKLVGPAIGGFMIKYFGEGVCFLINGISYFSVIFSLLMMKDIRQDKKPSGSYNIIRDMYEGFRYVSHDIPIRNVLLLMSCTSLFGLPLMTYIPAFVKDILMGDSTTQSYLYSGIGLGAVSASIMLAIRKTPLGLGHFSAYSGIIMGIGLLVMCRITTPMLAAVISIPIGFGIIANVAAINTILQNLSIEDKRGRVMGYLSMTFNGVAPVGTFLLSLLEESIRLPGIILICGIGSIIGCILFLTTCRRLIQISYPTYQTKGIITSRTLPSEIRF